MAKQHQQLSDAIEDFTRFRSSMDLSKKTLQVQKGILRRFLAVNGNIWCYQINESHVARYMEEAAKTKQPQSLRNDHTVLAGFFAWMRKTKRMGGDADPMWGRRKPRAIKRERSRLPVSKFSALLDAAEARSPRDRAAVAVLLYTLARDGEVTSLRIRDLELDNQRLRILRHKTRQEDSLPICTELDAELRRWLTTYANDVGFLEPGYLLIPARDTKSLRQSDGSIWKQEHVRFAPDRKIRELGKVVVPALADIGFPVRDEAGNSFREGAHTIRRSGARAMFDQLVGMGHDGALRVVQSFLGHASVAQTEHYIGVTADRRTRDDLFAGKPMYNLGTVTQLRREREA